MKLSNHPFWRAACFVTILMISRTISFADTALIVYVRTGDVDKDNHSLGSLDAMVKNLNTGGSSAGWTYKLVDAMAFERPAPGDPPGAIDIAREKPFNATTVFLVAHGVFSGGVYTGNLKQAGGDSVPAESVGPYFAKKFHCNQDGEVDQDQIGHGISDYNGHSYSNTSKRTVIDSPRSEDIGRTTSGTASGLGSWALYGFPATYGYLNPANGAWVVVGYTAYVWVWEGVDGNPGNENMAMVLPNPHVPKFLETRSHYGPFVRRIERARLVQKKTFADQPNGEGFVLVAQSPT